MQLDDSVQTWKLEMVHAGTGRVRQPGLGLVVGTRKIDRLESQEAQPGQHG